MIILIREIRAITTNNMQNISTKHEIIAFIICNKKPFQAITLLKVTIIITVKN